LLYLRYFLQAAQLMAEHVLQGELPPTGVDTSSVPLEGKAKEENTRLALLWQWGQEAISSD
jgi:hypothetical protein